MLDCNKKGDKLLHKEIKGRSHDCQPITVICFYFLIRDGGILVKSAARPDFIQMRAEIAHPVLHHSPHVMFNPIQLGPEVTSHASSTV